MTKRRTGVGHRQYLVWELKVETVTEWLREQAETVDVEIVWDTARDELFKRHLRRAIE